MSCSYWIFSTSSEVFLCSCPSSDGSFHSACVWPLSATLRFLQISVDFWLRIRIESETPKSDCNGLCRLINFPLMLLFSSLPFPLSSPKLGAPKSRASAGLQESYISFFPVFCVVRRGTWRAVHLTEIFRTGGQELTLRTVGTRLTLRVNSHLLSTLCL